MGTNRDDPDVWWGVLTLTPELINGRLTVFALLLGVLILVITISSVLLLMARARYRATAPRKLRPKIVRPDPWREAGERVSVDPFEDNPPDDDPGNDDDDDGDVPAPSRPPQLSPAATE